MESSRRFCAISCLILRDSALHLLLERHLRSNFSGDSGRNFTAQDAEDAGDDSAVHARPRVTASPPHRVTASPPHHVTAPLPHRVALHWPPPASARICWFFLASSS